MRYIYGVEKFGGLWFVCRFNANDKQAAAQWLHRGLILGTARWLGNRKTARAMAGEQAMRPENLIIWRG